MYFVSKQKSTLLRLDHISISVIYFQNKRSDESQVKDNLSCFAYEGSEVVSTSSTFKEILPPSGNVYIEKVVGLTFLFHASL